MKKYLIVITILIVCFEAAFLQAEENGDKQFAVDAGLYIADGSIGMLKLMSIDVSVNIIESLYAFAGTGFTPDYYFLDIGVYYLFLSPNNNLRPKVLAKYGPSSAVVFKKKYQDGSIGGIFNQFDEGFAVGAGVDWLPLFDRTLGFDFYVSYSFTNSEKAKFSPSALSIFDSVSSRLSFYFGFNYYFEL